MARDQNFNVSSCAIVDEINVEYVLTDGSIVTIYCDNRADAERVAAIEVQGIEVEFG